MAVGTAQAGEVRIDLGRSPGIGLGIVIRSAFFKAGQLTVEAAFTVSDAALVEGLSVELEAGGLVLQKATVAGPTGEGSMPSVRLQVSCSARTAKRALRLVLPSLKIVFAVGPLGSAPEPDVESVPDVLAIAQEVEGSFEGIRVTSNGTLLAAGWARDPSQPGAAVTVDVFLEDVPLASGRALSRRKDVATKKGGSDVAGFTVEIPPNICKGETVSVSARARTRRGALTSPTREVRFSPFGYNPSAASMPMQALLARPRFQKPGTTFAAVILTQDGADVLGPLLDSIQRYEEHSFQRIIVIDHESIDETVNVISTFSARLPLEHIIRPRTSSFSESNNYGASLSTEDIILFINNDIYLTAPIIGEMARFLTPEIGVVGIKLLDPPISNSRFGAQAPQHVAIHFDPAAPGGAKPFESRLLTDCPQANSMRSSARCNSGPFRYGPVGVPELGGFDEEYFYGWEDIDLCLRSLAAGKTNISVNSISAVHVRAHSRRQMPASVTERRNRNSTYFGGRWSYTLRRTLRSQQLAGNGYWTGRKLHFGFVVSEFGPEATAGDYMTALDFARAMERTTPSRSYFFNKNEPVDATDIDYLVVMTDDFDVRKVSGLGTTATVVGWARNWFHRWVSRPWRERFDLWFASSEHARRYMEEELCRSVALLRIGTDGQRFSKGGALDPKLASDVAFTGHFWGSPREVVSMLDEAGGLNIRFYGKGWDAHPAASHFWGGVLPYDRMVDVYKSTKVVIDDSNFVTATWGSLNSRVFDSLAAGALVLTNNAIGVAEAFPDVLPTYSSKETLVELLQLYVNDDAKRAEATARARALVMEHHTYDVRAREFLTAARERCTAGLRVAIKIGCPKLERADGWGDWYFANSLRRELEARGHAVRIDCLDDWYSPQSASDDVCLTLRGLDRYQPKPGQINLLWIISHPDKVTVEEINGYDRCFAASAKFVRTFADLVKCPISVLPQCTDSRIFFPAENATEQDMESQPVVFVGNSRGVSRPVVRAAAEAGVGLQVHGGGWAALLPESIVKSQLIQNDELGDLYRGARVVLNDHWEDMRRWEIVSNRIFDAVACGRPVISDDCEESHRISGIRS
ncbi:glycosyltransferase [Paeniroseomonas aquatica]|uniref:glycosyltransferase family protein n=2 Tax=Paeniroseomonas aquatica TaxID=373043 RepID=UPI003608C9CB